MALGRWWNTSDKNHHSEGITMYGHFATSIASDYSRSVGAQTQLENARRARRAARRARRSA